MKPASAVSTPDVPIAGVRRRNLGASAGFRHYAHAYLCRECLNVLRAFRPAKLRGVKALTARAVALSGRFPELFLGEVGAWRVQLDGATDGRSVRVSLRSSAREYCCERYAFRVALSPELTGVARHDLRLPPSLTERLCEGYPKLSRSDQHWLHIAFRRLGKLDAVHALEGLLASAKAIEGGVAVV
ncbi:MAG: hypothetical protein QM756_26015 [Polyangiaceae bacterium]